jgi:hypothetical protein
MSETMVYIDTDALLASLARVNDEANALTRRAEAAEAKALAYENALRRIADEPPNRGLTPDFRRFAQDALESVSP